MDFGDCFPNLPIFKPTRDLSGLVLIALCVSLLPPSSPVCGQVAGHPDVHLDVEASTDSTIYLPAIRNSLPSIDTTLVPKGAVWKYLDDGSDQGTAWREISFDDGSWQVGAAQLGYGDGDERTVVGYGPYAYDKYTTTYFRHAFNVHNPLTLKMLDLTLLRDDGVVVYLNNREILRSNMPAGDVTYTTWASASVRSDEERTWFHVSVNPGFLVDGRNVLAVEIHQRTPISSDISLDLELTGTPAGTARFAVIGDYGADGPAEAAVADLVRGWEPDFVITVGDNNYPNGAQSTIVDNIDQYYGAFITAGQFFPALGNHDWRSIGCTGDVCTGPYLNHFELPGNERFYDFARGNVHFFALDSDPHEPHGSDEGSIQADWLHDTLSNTTAQWKVVFFHHAPYSSANHGPYEPMQWPFEQWGASAVLAGHDHTYERLEIGGLPYFVNGLGGANRYSCGLLRAEDSQICFDADHGAMLVEAGDCQMRFTFVTRASVVVDTFSLGDSCSQ